jgi:acyl-CoA thioesterase-2
MRVRGRLPDDPAVHDALLAFVSDLGAVLAAAVPLGSRFGEFAEGSFMGASLDHAIWFHRPVRLDDWVLYDLRPVSNAGSRGLVQGTMHTRAGVLAASVAQEALIRVRRGDAPA